ncbi:MAG TPA: cytochrome c [Vicinamibacterales bacterium]|nr:cytochrome c [Vicinamibacterales bacterium]
MRNHFITITVILFAGSLLCGAALSAATAAAEDPRTIVDRVYSVAQADRGEARFKTSCSSCHTPGSFAGGSFAERWSGQTMAEVFDFVSNAMPENDPGGLEKEAYADVLAFILRVNAYPAGNDELPIDPAALKKLEIAPNPK